MQYYTDTQVVGQSPKYVLTQEDNFRGISTEMLISIIAKNNVTDNGSGDTAF